MYLPRHLAPAENGQVQAPAVAAPAVRGSETILLVEDETAILAMTTTMLEQLGYTVLAAGRPGEAIRLAEQYSGEIHLLMSDVVMPGMNGSDLAGNLVSRYPHLKRLFMSGYTANVIAHHGVLNEGVHFLQKPFSRRDLADKVREALDAPEWTAP
jgi:DNA-binding NtrC family response regulator